MYAQLVFSFEWKEQLFFCAKYAQLVFSFEWKEQLAQLSDRHEKAKVVAVLASVASYQSVTHLIPYENMPNKFIYFKPHPGSKGVPFSRLWFACPWVSQQCVMQPCSHRVQGPHPCDPDLFRSVPDLAH